MRKQKLLVLMTVAVAALYIGNASWRVSSSKPQIQLIAHRGVHQNFHRKDLNNDTCTATRMDEPSHGYLENTIASMRAAFAAGANVVELDVHPTTDRKFAVIHDWTLECRTNGSGPVRRHDLAYLKSLDIGYGYTADGGKTFPFRGQGVGMLPELSEVFSALPNQQFLVNFKSREAREGDMLATFLSDTPVYRPMVWGVYGGAEPSYRAAALTKGGLRAWSNQNIKGCLKRYIAMGGFGVMPEACKNTVVLVPYNVAPLLWGWPNLFLKRFHAVGSEIILVGRYDFGDPASGGIDTVEELSAVPDNFSGYLWTNKIEIIGPAARVRWKPTE